MGLRRLPRRAKEKDDAVKAWMLSAGATGRIRPRPRVRVRGVLPAIDDRREPRRSPLAVRRDLPSQETYAMPQAASQKGLKPTEKGKAIAGGTTRTPGRIEAAKARAVKQAHSGPARQQPRGYQEELEDLIWVMKVQHCLRLANGKQS